MPNQFTPLHQYLREKQNASEPVPDPKSPPVQEEFEHGEALSASRRFYAAVAEALEDSLDRLLREVACEIIGRELCLTPVALREIVERMLAEMRDAAILRLRVCPGDAEKFNDFDIPVVPDTSLQSGDAILELQEGSIDARLGVRLDHLLQTVRTA